MYSFISVTREFARSRFTASARKCPLLLVVVINAVMLAAGFVSPYHYERQDRESPLSPPTRIHFFDQHHRFHWRPFVYGHQAERAEFAAARENQEVVFPIYFFVPGTEYRLFGLLPARTHLFGVGPGGRIFVLGTDGVGRDQFSRLLYGGQMSLFTGVMAAGLAVGTGLVLGTLAGFYGKWLDDMLMRGAEAFLAIPWLYLLLAIRAVLPLHLNARSVFLLLMCVSGLIGWARPARIVRGVVLRGREREYVLAARGFGATELYVLRTHILPQAYAVAATQLALYIPQFITSEVVLSFFGLGVSEPVPSWGNMLAQLRSLFVLESCWWMLSPAVVLVFVLITFEWFFRVQLRSIYNPEFGQM
jgi:peptide/nickel transport system permease protein